MTSKNISNYRIFLLSNSILMVGLGVFMPFWLLFIQKIGGSIEQFGFALGLMWVVQAITSYVVGKHSDSFGRKPLLIFTGFLSAAIVLGYALVSTLMQLYAIQIMNGVGNAMLMTLETIFLGDITQKISRGADIGKYRLVLDALFGLSVMFAGFMIGQFEFKMVFYVVAAIIFIATLILFFIRE